MRRALPAAFVVLLGWGGAASASACPSCFGQADGPMADATRVGMWVLLALTLALQGALAAFFLHLRRRAAQWKAHEDSVGEEWSRLQASWRGGDGRAAR